VAGAEPGSTTDGSMRELIALSRAASMLAMSADTQAAAPPR
jgi:hypothetical protein